MEKKRSKGVTFWAWLFIISAIVGLLQAIDPKQEIQFYGIGMLIFWIIESLAYLICGIYLLKLHNFARKTAIILCIISFISIPFYLKPGLTQMESDNFYLKRKQIIIEQMKPEFQQKELVNLEKTRENYKKIAPIVVIAMYGMQFLIFALIPIYFFTRPKVKEQFRQSASSSGQ